MITRRAALKGAALVASTPFIVKASSVQADTDSSTGEAVDISKLPRVKPKLVKPPFVHEHEQVATTGPKIVEFELKITEEELEIDDGVFLQALTFNGSIPGPMMVLHEGDYMEITLYNPAENELQHNIAFHASLGALAGADLTLVNPGEKVTMRFKATRPGAFIYHCSPGGPMIPWHVVSGMTGAVLVLPREGLKDQNDEPMTYDKVYYVGETDFYIPKDEEGNFKRYKSAGEGYDDMLDKMLTLIPSHIVFNGKVGALTGEGAMKAKVGEKVLFIHSQANKDTKPHLIGGHGDLVWQWGKFDNKPLVGLETWFVPSGSAGVAMHEFKQPGLYAYISHQLIEAVHFGAAGHVVVEGEWNNDLMTQVQAPVEYDPSEDADVGY